MQILKSSSRIKHLGWKGEVPLGTTALNSRKVTMQLVINRMSGGQAQGMRQEQVFQFGQNMARH